MNFMLIGNDSKRTAIMHQISADDDEMIHMLRALAHGIYRMIKSMCADCVPPKDVIHTYVKATEMALLDIRKRDKADAS